MVRINLSIPDRTPDRFTHVAGGERKRGEWLAKMVDAAYEGKATPDTNDVESLRYQLIGVMSKVNGLENELNDMRRQLEQSSA